MEVSAAGTQGAPVQNFLFGALWRYRRGIVRAMLLGAVIGLVWSLLAPEDWTVTAKFQAHDSDAEIEAASVGPRARLGPEIAPMEQMSHYFYPYLIETTDLLERVALRRLQPPSTDAGKEVLDVLGISERDHEARKVRAIEVLREDVVSTLYDQRIEVTSFTVTTDNAENSLQIALALLAEANRFILNRHRTLAQAGVTFSERQMREAAAERRAAEESVQAFLMAHRGFMESAEQSTELARLKRRLSTLLNTEQNLRDTYEKALIEQSRDVPQLTWIAPPERPQTPDRRYAVEWMIGGVGLALYLAIGLLALQHVLGLARTSGEDAVSFREIWPELRGELLHPWRLVL